MTINDFFLHNWSDNASLESAYDTNIVQSYKTLVEERRALLDRPHRTLSMRWTGVKRDETNRLLMELMRSGSQQVLVPFVMDQSLVTASSSGTTINCDTTNRRFVSGGQFLIFALDGDGRPTNAQVGTIDGTTAGTITAHAAITGTYATGALVFPLMLADLALEHNMRLLTEDYGDLSVSFIEAYPTALPASAGPSTPGAFGTQVSAANAVASATTPILNVSPNFAKAVAVKVIRPGTRYALGRTQAIETQGLRALLEFSFQLLLADRASSWAFQNFFDARLGSLISFWFVSPATLWTLVGQGLNFVDVAVSGDIQNATDFVEYVAIVMLDGTVYVRKITSVTLVGGAWRLACSIASLGLGNIARVTSAHFVRFSGDAMTLVHLTDGVCVVSVAVREILAETVTGTVTVPACPTG